MKKSSLPSPSRLLRLSSSLIFVVIWIIASLSSSSAGIPSFWKVWLRGGVTGGGRQVSPSTWNDTEAPDTDEDSSSKAIAVWKRWFNNETTTANDWEEMENGTVSQKKLKFLDRIALVSSSLMKREKDAHLLEDYDEEALDQVTQKSDLTLPGRHIHVVTTAGLPWFTGTAVNPLLRAAYLHRRTQEINRHAMESNSTTTTRWVTLVIPWLELPEDQQELYGRVFESEQEQEDFIRAWLWDEAGLQDAACPETGLEIIFYPARYHSGLGSIFAMGDLISFIPEEKRDVCVLEEPEHLNWYRHPSDGWTKRFQFVIGIVHTNYREYASALYHGLWTAPALSMMSSAMVRAYCDKVIKLSDTLQTYAPEKEVTSNVHGVRSDFLREGIRRAQLAKRRGDHDEPVDESQVGVYFVGKLLWAKGLDIMLDLEDYYESCTGRYFEIDIYGSGPDQTEIMKAFHGRRRVIAEEAKEEGQVKTSILGPTWTLSADDIPKSFAEFRKKPIPATFPGRVDHATLKDYQVFVNPSLSEVLCTTTAEALAMGKFVIIPVHPSNTFFLKFPNCLAYRNRLEFVANLRWALTHEPKPLTPEQEREFTWEAATDRFIAASAITRRQALERERLGRSKLDQRIAWLHTEIGKGAKGDYLRKILGAGPASHQVKYQIEQQRITDETEEESEDEDDGLSKKFRRSAFAEAIRTTVGDLSSFIE